MLYRVLTTSVVINTESLDSRRSNYHTITTMTAHIRKKIDEFTLCSLFQNRLFFSKILHLLFWYDNRVIKHHIISFGRYTEYSFQHQCHNQQLHGQRRNNFDAKYIGIGSLFIPSWNFTGVTNHQINILDNAMNFNFSIYGKSL